MLPPLTLGLNGEGAHGFVSVGFVLFRDLTQLDFNDQRSFFRAMSLASKASI